MFNFVKDNQAELKLKKRISQRDIAKILGVNVSTVSRALKGLGGVGAELRKKIERLAEVSAIPTSEPSGQSS
jgi:transcriptional regulator with XRE-family HTH domain